MLVPSSVPAWVQHTTPASSNVVHSGLFGLLTDCFALQALLSEVRTRGPHVPEVSWCVPGEDAAAAALMGEQGGFLTAKRLSLYKEKRNDPAEPQVWCEAGCC